MLVKNTIDAVEQRLRRREAVLSHAWLVEADAVQLPIPAVLISTLGWSRCVKSCPFGELVPICVHVEQGPCRNHWSVRTDHAYWVDAQDWDARPTEQR